MKERMHDNVPMVILVSIGLLVAVLAWVVSVYNRLFHLRNEVRGAWKQWILAARNRNEQLDDFANVFAGALPQENGAFGRIVRLGAVSRQLLRGLEELRWGAQGEALMPQSEWLLQRMLHESVDSVENAPHLQSHLQLQQLCGLMSMALYQQEHRARLFNRAASEYNMALASPGGRALASVFGFLPAGCLEAADDAAVENQ